MSREVDFRQLWSQDEPSSRLSTKERLPLTLIVSLRIPDGIVLAGDSLSTMLSPLEIRGQFEITCPNCEHEHSVDHQAQAPIPTSTFSYAQKVFPFLDSYGIGTSGAGQIGGRTPYFALKQMERELQDSKSGAPGNVDEVATYVGERMLEAVQAGVPGIEDAPDDVSVIGFQVVGYDRDEAKTIEVHIGKEVAMKEHSGPGCTVTGDPRVASGIWQLYKAHPEDQAVYPSFSLQDAIDYAEFLISTTASYQRFSRRMPTVGGEIDIALVTPFDNFRWIRQKTLARKLSEAH